MTPSETIARLRELAGKATPGPWCIMGDGRQVFEFKGGMVANCNVQLHDDDDEAGYDIDHARSVANVNYVTALDPSTVLTLLDVAEAAEKIVATIREAHEDAGEIIYEPNTDELVAALSALSDQDGGKDR